eukprot:11521677-Prorocentrum_lima.AAC.1
MAAQSRNRAVRALTSPRGPPQARVAPEEAVTAAGSSTTTAPGMNVAGEGEMSKALSRPRGGC